MAAAVLRSKSSRATASLSSLQLTSHFKSSLIWKGFTRMVLSIWAMTTISLFIRIQVNMLGRHLYIDTAHDLGGLQPDSCISSNLGIKDVPSLSYSKSVTSVKLDLEVLVHKHMGNNFLYAINRPNYNCAV
ncbi:hypothetical protein L1887_38577 [Cichorium endivia]|nr:hypothetical protein L1887_38577 [Cichorium endivia]